MKSSQWILAAAVAGVVGIGAGYMAGGWCGAGGPSGAAMATIDCASSKTMGSVVSVKGTALSPDQIPLEKKVAYLDLLRDFWTRRMSVMEDVALTSLAQGDAAQAPGEPSEEQVMALYEANIKAFPATMKKEEILNNLRQMLRSQNKYRADAERRIKATRDGSLVYTAGVTCGPRMSEIRETAGATSTLTMVGSFFCPECRGNFGHIDRWLEDAQKTGKKVSFGHVAVAATEGSADFLMVRAEICVMKDHADKLASFLRYAHRAPSQASASEEAARPALENIVAEMKIDATAFMNCVASEPVMAQAKKRVELFKNLNPMSANVMLFNNRPLVMRRDRPEEIPGVLQSLLK